MLFLGGNTEWKLSAAASGVVAEAKVHDKWVHIGRVISERRLRYAYHIGCDSADGTYIAYKSSVYVGKVRHWLRSLFAA